MTEIRKIDNCGTAGDQPSSKPSDVLEIEFSPGKLIRLTALGFLMTAAAVFVALSAGPSLVAKLFGYFGTLFFGAATVKSLWLLLSSSGPVVTITPEGIRDTRIAAQFIPWTAITRIWTWRYGSQKAMILVLKPGAAEQLDLTLLARWARIANPLVGVNGLAIGAAEIKTDYQTLLQMSLAYARAYNPHIALTP